VSEVARAGSLTKQIRLVVTVKSYPQPSSRYHESVCVAGIRRDTRDPQWVRLYPVQFRDLLRRQAARCKGKDLGQRSTDLRSRER
jgi:hypothetical protein